MPRSSQSRPQCAQIADHLAQNTPNSLNFTEVVCTLGASIPNTANMETAARSRGLPQCPWAAEPGWTSETTRRAKLAARTASGRADPHQSPRPHRSGGRRRVQRAGWPDNEPTRPATHSDTAPPVWRAPEGPEGQGGLRGAAPNEVRSPSLAGGRALRRPEHPWGHKQPDPASGRAAAHGHTKQPDPAGARNISSTTSNTAHQAPPVWRAPEGTEGQTAVPVGGGRAWPDNEPTRRAKLAARTASGRADPHQSPRPHRSGGRRRDRRARVARLRCPWAAAGPGRASSRRAERSSRRGRRAGGPPPTGTPSSPAQQLPDNAYDSETSPETPSPRGSRRTRPR